MEETMFFSSSSSEEKNKPSWSVSSDSVTNTKIDKVYPISEIFYALNDDRDGATLWFNNRYLTTLKVDKKVVSTLEDRCWGRKCNDFIPQLSDLSFVDSSNIEWNRLNQDLVSNDGRCFSLGSLRFENISENESNALCYGEPVFSFNASLKQELEHSKDVVLQQIHGRLTGQALEKYKSTQEVNLVQKSLSNADVLLTTETVISFDIEKRIDVITAEVAFGMNIFKDIFAAFSDVFGGRNKSISNTLKDARLLVLQELRLEAMRVGANAVIAIDLDYSEISGNGKSMLFVVASGTAVRIKR
jgi:uncharacterized protein YbjQ (UPF0145 family)